MYANMSHQQFFRHAVLSSVLAKIAAGMTKSDAIVETAELSFADPQTGKNRKTKIRTIYRWMAAYEKGGVEALKNKDRVSTDSVGVLNEKVIEFLKNSKIADPEASIPDIILAAEKCGIVKSSDLSRTTVWRAAKKLNLPLMGIQGKAASVKRRFAYEHRMQMVLCDGKQFRAGVKRNKRLVFSFIDDATRKVLATVVGSSETKELFLRGIHKVLMRYGKMVCLYVDNGSGFIADDTKTICARLGIHLIHGTAGYPEGHGKIERFNRTLSCDLLRTFSGDPEISDNFNSLETRIEHYIREIYNQRKHEGIEKCTPDERWTKDSISLLSIDNTEALDRVFVVGKKRKVSADNIVKLDGLSYEMPIGHAGKSVLVSEDILHSTYSVIHDGKNMILQKVDLALNAKAKRAAPEEKNQTQNGPTRTAARRSYSNDLEPIVTETGDYFETT